MQRIVASWFGTGLILGRLRGSDAGSGTIGSLFAIPVWWVTSSQGVLVEIVIALGLAGVAVWSASPFASDHADPGWVVVDEAAGTLFALIGASGWPAVVAWVVFRLADIFKGAFPGVAAAERLPGSIGITTDDVVAGLYGLLAGLIAAAIM
jgi:phosphatidylglycerophosphatase A